MKNWLLLLLLSAGLPGWHWLTRVRDYNATQAQGQAAARAGHPLEAAYLLRQATELAGRGGPAPTLLLDLAQAQAQAGQLAEARATYARLLGPAVPATLGSTARQQLAVLLARQGQVAQALGFLRQALTLNPANAAARYNFELLTQYLGGQQPAHPPTPPPAGGSPPPPARPDSSASAKGGSAPQPSAKAGGNKPGEAATPGAPPPGGSTQAPQPSASGQPDKQRPTPNAGSNAKGGFRPGAGDSQPLASGREPGTQHGLAAGTAGPNAAGGRGSGPGQDAATNADLTLQTQRERLKAMSLTPAQAEQVLDALRESEQQYLQQQPRQRQGAAPVPGQPTW